MNFGWITAIVTAATQHHDIEDITQLIFVPQFLMPTDKNGNPPLCSGLIIRSWEIKSFETEDADIVAIGQNECRHLVYL